MKKDKGFTLIELLVVAAIIGILATVVLASVGKARVKAKIAKTQMNLDQIEIYVAGAQINSNLFLKDITEDENTFDSCDGLGDLSLVPQASLCVGDWKDAIDAIVTNYDSTIVDGSAYYSDAWGSPYLLDENEALGVCIVNTLTSAGPDKLYGSADDIVIILPYERC